jgi:hypothetical protein
VKVMQSFRAKAGLGEGEKVRAVLAAGRQKTGIKEEKEKVRGVVGGVLQRGAQR